MNALLHEEAMVDIECLSTEPDAAVISIGLCLFDAQQILASREILLDPRLSPGHRDARTISWWESQDPKVWEHAMSGKLAPSQACHTFREIIQEWGVEILWANPPQFDIVILRNLFKVSDVEFPIHHANERDFRTMRKLAGQYGIDYSEPYDRRVAHDAESDAVCQAQSLQIIVDAFRP